MWLKLFVCILFSLYQKPRAAQSGSVDLLLVGGSNSHVIFTALSYNTCPDCWACIIYFPGCQFLKITSSHILPCPQIHTHLSPGIFFPSISSVRLCFMISSFRPPTGKEDPATMCILDSNWYSVVAKITDWHQSRGWNLFWWCVQPLAAEMHCKLSGTCNLQLTAISSLLISTTCQILCCNNFFAKQTKNEQGIL